LFGVLDRQKEEWERIGTDMESVSFSSWEWPWPEPWSCWRPEVLAVLMVGSCSRRISGSVWSRSTSSRCNVLWSWSQRLLQSLLLVRGKSSGLSSIGPWWPLYTWNVYRHWTHWWSVCEGRGSRPLGGWTVLPLTRSSWPSGVDFHVLGFVSCDDVVQDPDETSRLKLDGLSTLDLDWGKSSCFKTGVVGGHHA